MPNQSNVDKNVEYTLTANTSKFSKDITAAITQLDKLDVKLSRMLKRKILRYR